MSGNNFMVSVNEAFKLIETHCSTLGTQVLPIVDTLGLILANDIHSAIDMPPFNQSAMDGYAVHMNGSNSYQLVGEIKAGDNASLYLEPGEAIRIFTGGKVPEGANTVAKQEVVKVNENSIELEELVELNANIRPKGEQMQKGNIALNKGTQITPGTVGFLAMLGIEQVEVYRRPSIGLITTGNELVAPGNQLPEGKIFESNSYMLKAALKQLGYEVRITTIEDSYEQTLSSIRDTLETNDLVLLTGGISVGDYDFVGKALKEIGVKQVFYKVKQKPGKPVYFGVMENQYVFALPGNPAAALTCFYIYVRHAISRITGRSAKTIESHAAVRNDYKKKKGLTHFLKGRMDSGNVEILSDQSSAMLTSFVTANCLIRIDEEMELLESGDRVTIYPL